MFNIHMAILVGMKRMGMCHYKQVWTKLGIDSSSMSNIIHGKVTPLLFTVQCFATLFEVSLSGFIAWGEQDLDMEKLKGEVLAWQR